MITHMKIIVDNREHNLWDKLENLQKTVPLTTITFEKSALPIGDILLRSENDEKDRLIIERKTLSDLLSSIKDGRYEEQSHRLKYTSNLPSHYVLYIIEGPLSTITSAEKRIVFSVMASISYFKGFSVLRTSGIQETAEIIYYMSDKIERSLSKGISPAFLLESKEPVDGEEQFISAGEPSYSSFVKKVKKENIREDNIAEIMLCQIPGIQSKYASAVLLHFKTFSKMMEEVKAGTADFSKITYDCNGKSRKIPKSCGDSIVLYLQNI